jgi:hypothetical protein
MLSVMADGSTIYPSAATDPTPRYDTGTFFASGQDPVRKDVLEMLLRLFDRERLAMIPALEFASPLPELEAVLREGGPNAEGIAWIGPEGTSWQQAFPPRRGTAAYYNVLHPRVQEAMLTVVREVAKACVGHPAFSGLALQLSTQGYAQLPGPEWGLDDATIARFEQDTKIHVPGDGPDRFTQRFHFLNSAAAEGRRDLHREWMEWRAVQLTRLYRRILKELDAVRPGARLYLAGGEMLAGPDVQPALTRRTSLAEAMFRVGIDLRQLAEIPGIVLPRPQRITPRWSLADQAVNLEIRQMSESDRYFQRLRVPGELFFHQPQEIRVPSFDEKSPYRPCYTWLASEPLPSDAQNRRRFAHSLATLDSHAIFDGGWTIPMGQEDSLRELVAVYRQLPAIRFERVQPRSGQGPAEGDSGHGDRAFRSVTDAVIVRHATRDDRTYAYLVNDTPFATTARVRVDLPDGCRMEPLGGSRPIGPLRRDADGAYWEAELAPYDLVAAWFSAPNVPIHSPEATCPKEIQVALEKQLGDLGDRIAGLPTPPLFQTLENADFERPPGKPDQVPGWTVIGPPGVNAQLDSEIKHGGMRSVRFSSAGPPAAFVSHPFKAPSTGRLSILVWLRVADAARQPPLSIALVSPVDGHEFYRSAPVGRSVPGCTSPKPINVEWTRFIVHVNDLPLPAKKLPQLHVRFELAAAGEVWIDDVQLCDVWFTREEQRYLVRLLAPTDARLQDGQVADCIRLLEGYWPRFLIENAPLPLTPIARPEPREPQREASILERMKNFVPNPLRF